jgi:hypothetical protein
VQFDIRIAAIASDVKHEQLHRALVDISRAAPRPGLRIPVIIARNEAVNTPPGVV